MNSEGLQGISLSNPLDYELQHSSLNGLFQSPPTHTTFIDGYYERFTPKQPISGLSLSLDRIMGPSHKKCERLTCPDPPHQFLSSRQAKPPS